MTDKQLDKLIKKRVDNAHEMQQVRAKLDPLIESRYGVHYSDIDCDAAIDAMDYGVAGIDLATLDQEMTDCGYPPNSEV